MVDQQQAELGNALILDMLRITYSLEPGKSLIATLIFVWGEYNAVGV